MPEGPEIRIAADQVAEAIVDRPLAKVFFAFPELKRFQQDLCGETVTAVDTRGKAMLTRFSNGLTMYSHNQLYGRWYTTGGELPETGRSLRAAFYTADDCAFLYSASAIEMLDDNDIEGHPFLSKLGPDILDASPADVVSQLRSKRFSGRALASLYLDQSFLAGNGNYLRSEILHYARLYYSAKPIDLSAAELRRLANVTCTLAERSYRTRGVTNPQGLVRRLRRSNYAWAQHRFAVFGREGKRCHECAGEIRRVDAAGRRLYFCPGCQSH